MNHSTKWLLFVDDEPDILEMLSRMLRDYEPGWEAEFRLGVDEALLSLSRMDFDVVVSDIHMPEKDGFALFEAMRNDDRLRRIPLIFLTGAGDRTLKRRALDMGATDLLDKPISREDLVARLRSALRLKDYQDQLRSQLDLLEGLVRERTRQLEESHQEVVRRLAKAGEFRDDETGDDVARVAWYSRGLAEAIGMDANFIELLFQTSPLHDLGKIGIPDSILLKPGRLTPEERQVMERHSLIGEDILRHAPKTVTFPRRGVSAASSDIRPNLQSPLICMAAVIARCHHEKWDGSGYPDGLAGEAIPIEARIVGLADVYDAIVSDRPYKRAMSKDEALAIIRTESGHHFDARLADAFLAHLDKIGLRNGLSTCEKVCEETGG